MEHGPVDVIVLAMGQPRFDGRVVAELGNLAQQGTIRVLDAMVLLKREDGSHMSLDIEDMPAEDAVALGFVERETRGMFDSQDADTLFEGMAPGSAVVALAIEHVWAKALGEAMRGTGAELALNIRVPAPLVDEALAVTV